ncbi:MAG: hypothetical protein KGS09_21160 [Nitrospirae bacterium]|nr:hypothetical protein [Nitrospirota bacterium]MDE3040590.1 hypothetical protein [Nitrospirota bacterium]MDE3049798.1 hypothetical protein [Nitrospirota bacterium]MDE3219151.1 hypothetical protein [Nitrospirota bacterium]
MILAGVFAGLLCLGLILGDWLYFVRLTPDASRYGCGVARTHDRFTHTTMKQLADRFDADGLLTLPHGTARLFPDTNQIVIRQKYRLFAIGFRTLWPIKGLISLSPEGDALSVLCRKLTPWSSALLTGIWFALVVVGTMGALIALFLEGELASLVGVVLAFGILGLGLVFLVSGAITVMFAYRLENARLTTVYQELREILEGAKLPT